MKRFILPSTIAFGLLLLVTACGDRGDNAISGNGTIVYANLEGGCWSVDLDNDGTYLFDNLPDAYRQDSIRVWILAKLSKDQFSFCNSGLGKIDVIQIRKL